MKYIIIALLVATQGFAQTETKQDSVSKMNFGNKIIFSDSITAVNQPLYLIDDRPATINEIKGIKPEMIKSIIVLKDEEAIAKYGEKAVNGAVIIKTKTLSKREFKRLEKSK